MSVATGHTAGATVTPRSVLIVSPDGDLRHRIADQLTLMRWKPLEANGGAEAFQHLDCGRPEAILLDGWLPDLDAEEFRREIITLFPEIELMALDGTAGSTGRKGPRRHELLHALREAGEGSVTGVHVAVTAATGTGAAGTAAAASKGVDGAAWLSAPECLPAARPLASVPVAQPVQPPSEARTLLPELVGNSAAMQALAEEVRLAAPFDVSVLIEGETGTGKELVARAVHRLSGRAARPFVVLNCAAIPEQLLEAELFGHTRGAFTGAVSSRTGRIEAAHGGTLFLDEIGELPLALQAKMLRFLESGELQRIGENESQHVDVRIVAATHQPLEEQAEAGVFRLDLFHRLAVFPVHLPPLRDRMDDVPMLAAYLLRKLGERMPAKRLSSDALEVLMGYHWPGNVRELGHVLERAVILAGNRADLLAQDIRVRRSPRQLAHC